MSLKRTATIGVVGAAFAAWLAGAATSNRVPPPVIMTPPAIEARGAELAREIARLHERLRPTASPKQPGRNLFTFRAAPPRAVAPPAAAPAIAAPAIVEAPIALLVLKLAGIAEDDGPNGPDRTAIISGQGQLFMVKEGDLVTPRYRVAKISADVVELTDTTDNSVRRLALK